MLHASEFWSKRRVCVVGGTGFLGWHLVRQLADAGAQVHVFGLPPRGDHPLPHDARILTYFGDVRDGSAIREAVADCSVIFNVAGVVAAAAHDRKEFHAVHSAAVQQILHAAPNSARIVHTSSIVTLGATTTGTTLSEDCPISGAFAKVDYVRAKYDAEQIALAAAANGRDLVVTNPGYLVGPEDYSGSVMGRVCLRFWNGRLPLAPPGGWNVADVRDVATGHLLAAERGQSGRRYVLGGENCSGRAFCQRLAQAAGAVPRLDLAMPAWGIIPFALLAETRARLVKRIPFPSLQEARLQKRFWYVRSDRAEQELGYQHRSIDESIRDSFRWHRDQGLIRPRGVRRWWLRPAA